MTKFPAVHGACVKIPPQVVLTGRHAAIEVINKKCHCTCYIISSKWRVMTHIMLPLLSRTIWRNQPQASTPHGPVVLIAMEKWERWQKPCRKKKWEKGLCWTNAPLLIGLRSLCQVTSQTIADIKTHCDSCTWADGNTVTSTAAESVSISYYDDNTLVL